MNAKADRDALLAQCHAVGLVPIVSTNGGVPEADIQVAFEVGAPNKPGTLLSAHLTARGTARLLAAQKAPA